MYSIYDILVGWKHNKEVIEIVVIVIFLDCKWT
jgi:hypothetical protein